MKTMRILRTTWEINNAININKRSMKNRKNITIILVTAALTFGGLSLARAKMYRHHYQDKFGQCEKVHENGDRSWDNPKDISTKKSDNMK